MISIFGGIRNRKTNRLVTDRKAYFLPMAYSAVIVVGLALAFTFLNPFINMFMLYQMATTPSIRDGADWNDQLVSRILLVVIFFVFMALMIIPTVVEDAMGKKKYGSVEAYDQAKADEIASIIAAADAQNVLEATQEVEQASEVKDEAWAVINREPLVDQEPLAVVEDIPLAEVKEVDTSNACGGDCDDKSCTSN